MRKRTSLGFSAVTVLLFMFVALTLMLSLSGLAMQAMTRSQNEAKDMQAFQIAQSLAEYQANLSYQNSKKTKGLIAAGKYGLTDLASSITPGAVGAATVVPTADQTHAWVTGFGFYGGKNRSVRIYIATKDVSIWNNAVFAGTGATGQSINGNVDIRGSVHILGEGEPYADLNGNGHWDPAEIYNDTNGNGVWDPGEPFVDANNDGVWNSAEPYNDTNFNGVYDPPLTTTDLSSDLGGTAHVGNNYYNMPAALRAMIPDPTIVNGQETLNAEVRAKHGQISINGSATVGDAVDPSVTMKGTLDGTYVSDGWTGNQGANSVFSDNGTNHSYDLQSLDITYPIISGIGAQEYTDPNGTVWTDQQTYYDNEAMVVPVSQITSSTSAFAYADLNGNSISYVPATATTPATLSVKGIVKVKGDLEIKVKGGLKYNGRGTLYATQDIYVGSNLLPSAGLSFPKDSAIGLVAGRNMNLATGAGDAQISMAGAFYAMGTITSAKQNQILGTFVANYFDMGKNVPNIYQVPSLRQNLPPGMPGDQLYLTLNVKSWRERK